MTSFEWKIRFLMQIHWARTVSFMMKLEPACYYSCAGEYISYYLTYRWCNVRILWFISSRMEPLYQAAKIHLRNYDTSKYTWQCDRQQCPLQQQQRHWTFPSISSDCIIFVRTDLQCRFACIYAKMSMWPPKHTIHIIFLSFVSQNWCVSGRLYNTLHMMFS